MHVPCFLMKGLTRDNSIKWNPLGTTMFQSRAANQVQNVFLCWGIQGSAFKEDSRNLPISCGNRSTGFNCFSNSASVSAKLQRQEPSAALLSCMVFVLSGVRRGLAISSCHGTSNTGTKSTPTSNKGYSFPCQARVKATPTCVLVRPGGTKLSLASFKR
ncbi:hypothetical protein E2C01_025858 [Portunus trituberculatus]|uniref:Uncharacterized protein n=1 Tax=Portunus trituberculatus TaxID=210409 RepID=A0A5B7EH99_PORTR|nr:hypothetical protein [Portunus trituberculatus]